jgi:hypothetical protein
MIADYFIRRADISDLSILTPMTLTLYGGDNTYDSLTKENTPLLTSDNDAVLIAIDCERAISFTHISLRHDYVEGTIKVGYQMQYQVIDVFTDKIFDGNPA